MRNPRIMPWTNRDGSTTWRVVVDDRRTRTNRRAVAFEKTAAKAAHYIIERVGHEEGIHTSDASRYHLCPSCGIDIRMDEDGFMDLHNLFCTLSDAECHDLTDNAPRRVRQ